MAKFGPQFESSEKDWETPSEIFSPLNREFGFTLDVCASSENAKCSKFFSDDNDGLGQRWSGICWMNPPFGQKKQWAEKAYTEGLYGATVVALLPARTNTNWWHDYCMKALEIRFLQGRPRFVGAEHGLPQPLAIVIFGPGMPCQPKLTSFDIRGE